MDSSNAETLQSRMRAVRHDLDEDFHEITERVREFGVWQSYVKNYPWVCLGTAAILGYLIIPKKQKPSVYVGSYTDQGSQLDGLPVTFRSQPHQSLSQVAMSFLGTAILRGVSTYIGNRVGAILEANYESTHKDEPS